MDPYRTLMICHFLSPFSPKPFGMNGGDDGARTRDLCRDSPPLWRNSLKPGVMDGNLKRPEEPFGTVIVPLMCPQSFFGDLCPLQFPEANFSSRFCRLGANISQRK